MMNTSCEVPETSQFPINVSLPRRRALIKVTSALTLIFRNAYNYQGGATYNRGGNLHERLITATKESLNWDFAKCTKVDHGRDDLDAEI